MEVNEIKDKVKAIIGQQFPELANIEPKIESDLSQSQLRAFRRQRSDVHQNEIPLEHRFIWQIEENEECPFDRTIVVLTDEEGNTQAIIESK
ncbi:hypothetical protein [Nostoc favosum]|uniref:Uncharacterized protein n=1 Tax=Nostoc favosum CHAB5714 TaxID=2780399 RepID=A0ABS8I9E1_9NOSO|nr:hypothetical protein [Nostoc favosum]MCC5600636.1 hypothetical protein [Nostoc favosum CHAB5714]